jgi:GTP cyclohydrolase II
MIKLLATGNLTTKFGDFTEYLFYDGLSEIIAIVKGDVAGCEDVLCRVHSHCIPAHIFNSIECDCREQMALAQEKIEENGKGVIVWLDQEGKGNGHMAAVLSAQLKMEGVPQTEAYEQLGYEKDARSFARAVEVIDFLKIASVRLMTNNPSKIKALTDLGINVSNTMGIFISPDNPELHKTYLDKIKNQNHSIKIS